MNYEGLIMLLLFVKVKRAKQGQGYKDQILFVLQRLLIEI